MICKTLWGNNKTDFYKEVEQIYMNQIKKKEG